MSSNLQGSLPLPGRLDCQCGVTMARLTQDVIANRVWLFAVVHLGTSSLCSRDCNGLHPLLPPFQKLGSFFYLQKIVSKKSNHMRSDTNSDGFRYQTFCIKCIYIQTSMNIQMPRKFFRKMYSIRRCQSFRWQDGSLVCQDEGRHLKTCASRLET